MDESVTGNYLGVVAMLFRRSLFSREPEMKTDLNMPVFEKS